MKEFYKIMKTIFPVTSLFILLFMILMGTGCKKEFVVPSNIILYDKPLSVIQSCIKGKWRLHYIYGGFSPSKIIDKYNSYMILSPDHITKGNDAQGIFVDTKISWIWSEYPHGYLFGYLSEYYMVLEIKNDTLIIRDNLDDGDKYYYTKY